MWLHGTMSFDLFLIIVINPLGNINVNWSKIRHWTMQTCICVKTKSICLVSDQLENSKKTQGSLSEGWQAAIIVITALSQMWKFNLRYSSPLRARRNVSVFIVLIPLIGSSVNHMDVITHLNWLSQHLATHGNSWHTVRPTMQVTPYQHQCFDKYIVFPQEKKKFNKIYIYFLEMGCR